MARDTERVVGGYQAVEVDERVEEVVAFAIGQLKTPATLQSILDVRAQVVSGMNYDVTYRLDDGEVWNALVYKNLQGEYSLVQQAKKN